MCISINVDLVRERTILDADLFTVITVGTICVREELLIHIRVILRE